MEENKTERLLGDMLGKAAAEGVKWVLLFGAISLMMIMRRDVGYRMIKFVHLLTSCFLLMFSGLLLAGFSGLLNFMSGGAVAIHNSPLFPSLYALLVFGCGIRQRTARWKELSAQNHRVHTRSVGVSRLYAISSLPLFLFDHRRMNRYVDPVAAFVAGILIAAILSSSLGIWLMFSAVCLALYEHIIHDAAFDNVLNTFDSVIENDAHRETLNAARGKDAATVKATKGDASMPDGVITIDPAIQENVSRMKAESQKAELAARRARERAALEAEPAPVTA